MTDCCTALVYERYAIGTFYESNICLPYAAISISGLSEFQKKKVKIDDHDHG